MLLKNYEGDLDQLNKQQKTSVEKAEVSQGIDMRIQAKKLRQDQVS